MAIFSNQATLTYNGNTANSNIAYGELLEVLTATKTALEGTYAPGELLTYVMTLRNTGATALTGLTITDDLGGYTFGAGTVYPLTLLPGSVRQIVNGVPGATPTVTAGPPSAISGITVPAGGDTVLLYQARVNAFADPGADGTIVNTATITGGGLTTPVTSDATVTGGAEPALAISKAINPTQVADNDRVTYTFVIQNTSSQAVDAGDAAAIADTFDPVLTDLVVTFDGATWAPNTNYTYNQLTGQFNTVAGQLTVPAATYTQDPVTGAYTITPGIATLAVTGTI